MRKIKVINKKKQSITLGPKVPFILNRIEIDLPVNIYKNKSPNRDGANYEGNTLGVGNVAITFTILAKNTAELEKNKHLFIQVFNPKFGELEIIEGKRKLKAIPSEVPYMNEKHPLEAKGVVNLDVHNPYWQNLSEVKAEIAKWVGTFSFPLSIPAEGIQMGYREPSLIVNVNNGGDVKTGMIIKFRALGTLTNPQLFDVNTREYFKANITMQKGDVLTVNTNEFHKGLELESGGVVSNVFNTMHWRSDFLQLERGDNLFQYDAETGLDNLEVDIYYNPKSLGV